MASGEIQVLRDEVAELRREVGELREAWRLLTIRQDSFDTHSEFSLVGTGGDRGSAYNSGGSTGFQGQGGQSVDTGEFRLGSERRDRIVRQVGIFLADSLAGRYRGSSQRDTLPLRSQLWIVVRGYNGTVFDPPRIFRRWHLAKDLVKQGSDCGDSVFVGLPAEQDCRRALEAAGLRYPERIEG